MRKSDFDAQRAINGIVKWIRKWFKANSGPNSKAVIGISGGKDSTIVAKLLVEALGKDRVIGVMMPNGTQADIDDSKRVIELLGIEGRTVNIKKSVEAIIEAINLENVSADTLINLPPRVRMTVLYAIAQSVEGGGRVANTCNASEDYVGYSTKYGDAAGDFSPCGNMLVTEMLQIGDALGLPYDLIHKTPSDGLCGQSDEDKLGFTYKELDKYITTGNCKTKKLKEKIDRMYRLNLHKQKPIPKYKYRKLF